MQNITGRTKRRQKRLEKKNLVKEDMEMNNEIINSLNKKIKKKIPNFFSKQEIENFSKGKASLNRMAGISDSNDILEVGYTGNPINFKYGRDLLNAAYGKYGKVLKESIILTIDEKQSGTNVYFNVADIRKIIIDEKLKEIDTIKKPLKKNLNTEKIIISYTISPIGKKNKDAGHQNIILIDNVNRIVERFEPHGSVTRGYSKKNQELIINSTYGILEYLKTIMEKYTGKEYKIFNDYVTEVCPLIGFQGVQEEEMNDALESLNGAFDDIEDERFREFFKHSGFGYCQMWTIFYAEKRLQRKYRNITTLKQRTQMIQDLIKEMQDPEKGGLSYIIHKYAQKVRLIARKINKHKKEYKKKSSRKSRSSYLSDSASGMSSLERELERSDFS
jgi:hypothetical protein